MTVYGKVETLLDFRGIVQSDLNVGAGSSLYPTTTIDSALNRSYTKCYRLFRWPGTEDAKYTNTQTNQDYYDAPTDFVPDSIWRLEVDGEMYGEEVDGSPMVFRDYLEWKIDNPTSTDKKWARQWTRYFIYPTPTTATSTITIWGQLNPTLMEGESDTTIFSYNLPVCNEAVIMEAEAILKHKGATPKDGEFYSAEAKSILSIAFSRIKQDNSLEKKTQPMLNVPDFFRSSRGTQVTANFVSQTTWHFWLVKKYEQEG